MVSKTTYVRNLKDSQIKEIRRKLQEELGTGKDVEDDIENALDSRLSDLEDIIDLKSLELTNIK